MKFKFYKTDILKMGGTAIVTAAIFAVLNLTATKSVFGFALSERIRLNDARTLAVEYEGYNRRLHVRYESPAGSGNYVTRTLQAMVFDAHQLDEIINHNKKLNADGTRDSIADEVAIYYGKAGSTGGVANMHIIAVGLKGSDLMLNRASPGDVNASSLFDRARPCPGSPGCPSGF